MQSAFHAAALLTAICFPGLVFGQPQPPEKVPAAAGLVAQLKPRHPRLLMNDEDFKTLAARVKSDATLTRWHDEVREDAEKMLTASMPRHVLPDGKRLLSTSRRVLDDTYTLALLYRLEGDRRYLDRLWKELEAVAAFPDFNPKHFLDTAEMTHALAVAYDWLYDTWSDSQRATIRRAIVEMGLKPSLETYRKNTWWARVTHNWNQVCNGGMTMGALAVGDEEPELCGEILHSAILSVPLAIESYAPDGAWGEGPGYWGYATTYNTVMLAGLVSALGTDFGLSTMPGFADTGLFPMYMTGPTGRTFNFEDSGDRLGRTDPMFWLAERFDRPEYAWFALRYGRPSAAGMVLYRGPGKAPASAGLPLGKYFRGVEAAALRSDWTDQATYVAVQSGSNRVNHNHLDLGSFVLDAIGERWAVDLGGDDYNLPGYFGGQRYNYYRLRAEGHNTLVLNPDKEPDQDPKSETRITRFAAEKDRSFALADLTPGYAKHASRVERGIALATGGRVLVQDEVEASKAVDLWWFMHTEATPRLEGDERRVVLRQGDRQLVAQILAPAQARFEVRNAEPLPSSPNPEGQRSNRSVRKLAIHLTDARDVRLAVLFTPGGAEAEPPPVKPLADW